MAVLRRQVLAVAARPPAVVAGASSVASQQQRIVAPAARAALRYVKSSVFFAPYWQPTMHSPHRRQA